MSFADDSNCCWATEFSDGSHAFDVNTARPPIPARPRYWVSATFTILFCGVHNPTSSCGHAVTRCPSRDCADDVTASIRPPPGNRMNSSPVLGITSSNGPSSIIGRNAPYTLSTCSCDTAVSWISGVGQ